MEGLPPDIERSLFKAVGAYLRATPPNELPTRVRPLRRLPRIGDVTSQEGDPRPARRRGPEGADRGVGARGQTDACQGRTRRTWPIATQREDGWLEELKGRGLRTNGRRRMESPDRSAKLAESLETERRPRPRRRRTTSSGSGRSIDAGAEGRSRTCGEARGRTRRGALQLIEPRDPTERRRSAMPGAAAERAEREVRRAVRTRTRRRSSATSSGSTSRTCRRSCAPRKRGSPRSNARTSRSPRRPRRARPKAPRDRRRKRKPLPVPKGRFEDAAETLDEWLRPGVS